MRMIALALMAAGCASRPPVSEIGSSDVRWRLVEKPREACVEAWASAGDGELAGSDPILVFEVEKHRPRFRPPARVPCVHRLHIEMDDDKPRQVGEPCTATVWIDGDQAHEVAIEATDADIAILGVEGAEPLAKSGTIRLAAGGRAAVTFTATSGGRAGIRARVLRELPK